MSQPEVNVSYTPIWSGEGRVVRVMNLRLTVDGREWIAIDPDNSRSIASEITQRIGSALHITPGRDISAGIEAAQAALRDFIAPPKPDEPSTWGVVEAACVHSAVRREWMRHIDDNWYVIGTDTKNNPDDWDSLIEPVVIREGVQS